MCWIKKMKRVIMIVILFITVVALLCLLQYGIQFYSKPIREYIELNAEAILVYNTEPVNCKSVNVELKGKTFHYLYKNEADGVQGNIWLNGTPLFGYGGADDIGFYLEFYEDLAYPCAWVTGKETPGNMITTSKELETIICGVYVTEDTGGKTDLPAGTQALLVIPAEEIETANTMIRETAAVSQPFADWLTENGWNQYVE